MGSRDDLIRAMNPPGKQAWSAEAQELNLLLHDFVPPAGWSMQYEVCNDDDVVHPTNCETFHRERTSAWREHLSRRHVKFGDDDDLQDRAAIPSDGHHVLIVLKHRDSGAEVRRWISRDELRGVAADPRVSKESKAAAMRTHAAVAITDCLPRVARKRAAIVERIVGSPEAELAVQLDRHGLASEMRETDDPDAVIDELIARVQGKGDPTDEWLKESGTSPDAAIERRRR